MNSFVRYVGRSTGATTVKTGGDWSPNF